MVAMTCQPRPAATIDRLSVRINQRRLQVVADVRLPRGGSLTAYLPDRELAALLPRSILAPVGRSEPSEVAETVAAILRRTLLGRQVRVRQYAAQYYMAFLSWRGVKFEGKDLRIEVKKRL